MTKHNNDKNDIATPYMYKKKYPNWVFITIQCQLLYRTKENCSLWRTTHKSLHALTKQLANLFNDAYMCNTQKTYNYKNDIWWAWWEKEPFMWQVTQTAKTRVIPNKSAQCQCKAVEETMSVRPQQIYQTDSTEDTANTPDWLKWGHSKYRHSRYTRRTQLRRSIQENKFLLIHRQWKLRTLQ